MSITEIGSKPNPRAPSEWHSGRIDRLKTLWAEGLSARQIANDLGGFDRCIDGGRSAVIGKIHRLGIAGTAPRNKKQASITHLSREEKARRQRERKMVRIAPPLACEPLPDEPLPHAGFLNITFDELAAGNCRYPLGPEPPFLFCGQPALAGKPYCLHCFGITHT